MRIVWGWLLGWVVCFSAHAVQLDQDLAQNDSTHCRQIEDIVFRGLRHTKEQALFREMIFRPNRSFCSDNWPAFLANEQQNLYNMGLFDTVAVRIHTPENANEWVEVAVKERWYIYPVPVFNLSGNSLSYWLTTLNKNPKFVTYGINFYHLNMSGMSDNLGLSFNWGANQQFRLDYTSPFLDTDGRFNLKVLLDLLQTRTVEYENTSHAPLYEFGDKHLLRYAGGFLSGTYRAQLTYMHTLSIGFEQVTIQDTLMKLNPNYMLDNQSRRRAFGINYTYGIDTRDNIRYPFKGLLLEAGIQRWGLGLFDEQNLWEASVLWDQYYPIGKKVYLAQESSLFSSAPAKRAYVDRMRLQTNIRTMRGYESFLIQGPHFAFTRTTLRYQLLQFEWNNNTQNKVLSYVSYIPFQFYPYVLFDQAWVAAYSDTANNIYNNRWIGSAGLGIDLYTFYDLVIGCYYAIQLPDTKGVFAFYLYRR